MGDEKSRKERYFLGTQGGTLPGNYDGSAVLIRDGKVLTAAEEERFIRIKHAYGLLPAKSIAWALKQQGITMQDIDFVSASHETYENWQEINENFLDINFGHVPDLKIFDHHLCHAAASYYAGKQDPTLILTMDYSGDRTSTLAAIGKNGKIEELFRMAKPNSLGIFYSMLTQYLGFQKDNDEYKVMGLSSYGNPNKFDFSNVLSTEHPYQLNFNYFKHYIEPNKPAPSSQEKIYANQLSLPEKARLPTDSITKYHADVAASGQRALEDTVLNLVKHMAEQTGIRNLCLGGGVALNCKMNQRIRESGLVDNLFVPPIVSDTGLPIGNAFLRCIEQGIKPQAPEHYYLGPSFSDDEIQKTLDLCKLDYLRPENLEEKVAKDIAKGRIVGWFQGGMELGPRALGNRSILADPRDAGMKDKINALVKFREAFRPFAPSVIEEKAEEYFENFVPSPYMTVTFTVKPEKRKLIPAVTHVNGTSRIQTVNKNYNPRYHNLISEFDKLTGIPMVLNTSLNIKGKPIDCTPRNALETFFATGMDRLAMGSFYLKKEN